MKWIPYYNVLHWILANILASIIKTHSPPPPHQKKQTKKKYFFVQYISWSWASAPWLIWCSLDFYDFVWMPSSRCSGCKLEWSHLFSFLSKNLKKTKLRNALFQRNTQKYPSLQIALWWNPEEDKYIWQEWNKYLQTKICVGILLCSDLLCNVICLSFLNPIKQMHAL